MRVLVVTNPFGGHAVGEAITDPAEIEAVLAGGHAGHVVAAERPDAPDEARTASPVGRPRKHAGDAPAFANNAPSQE